MSGGSWDSSKCEVLDAYIITLDLAMIEPSVQVYKLIPSPLPHSSCERPGHFEACTRQKPNLPTLGLGVHRRLRHTDHVFGPAQYQHCSRMISLRGDSLSLAVNHICGDAHAADRCWPSVKHVGVDLECQLDLGPHPRQHDLGDSACCWAGSTRAGSEADRVV